MSAGWFVARAGAFSIGYPVGAPVAAPAAARMGALGRLQSRAGSAIIIPMSTPIIPLQRGAETPAATKSAPIAPPVTAFNRRELGVILSVYGRMVAAGEWRDYAIDHLRDYAAFSVFHRATEAPLDRIEKHPEAASETGRLSSGWRRWTGAEARA